MKLLVCCDKGVNRSVTLGHLLKFSGHDVLTAGLETNDAETLRMLIDWADKTIVTAKDQPSKLKKVYGTIPLNMELRDLGPDQYPRPFNKELLRKCKKLIAEREIKLQPPDSYTRIPVYRRNEIVSYAFVDPEDSERVRREKWYLHAGYARTRNAAQQTIFMHRFVLGLDVGDEREVHHHSHNRLDNRRSNLQAMSKAEHRRSHGPAGSISGYSCVYPDRNHSRWIAEVKHKGTKHNLGTFEKPEDAAVVVEAFHTALAAIDKVAEDHSESANGVHFVGWDAKRGSVNAPEALEERKAA